MYLWLIEVVLGICLLVGAQIGIRKIVLHARKKAPSHSHDWRCQLDYIIYGPLSLLLWIIGISYAIDVIGYRFGLSVAIGYLATLRKVAVVGCLSWLFFRWKSEFQKSVLLEKVKKVDVGMVHTVGRLSTIAILILTGLIILQIFGLNIAPLLAFGSIGAASLGFAGKDVIANFCSGIMLNITRPFIVGDQIFLPEKELEGFIEEIGWFRTSLRDKERRPVYLPNNYFSTQIVVNISRMSHRRFKQSLKIPLNKTTEISPLSEKIRTVLSRHPKIDAQLPIHVYLSHFGECWAQVEIEAYSTEVDQDQFYQLHQELLLSIHKLLQEQNIELAIPELKTHITNQFKI